MNKHVYVLKLRELCCILILLFTGVAAATDSGSRVLATVEGTAITQMDVDFRLRAGHGRTVTTRMTMKTLPQRPQSVPPAMTTFRSRVIWQKMADSSISTYTRQRMQPPVARVVRNQQDTPKGQTVSHAMVSFQIVTWDRMAGR